MDLTIYTNYMKNMRQRLHQIPELCNNEYLTQDFILKEIKQMGYPYQTVGTGIIANLQAGGKKTICFRCDMDGLKLEEENDLPFRSRHKGQMHACGHDGHMALMLGLMAYLKDHPPKKVNVRFLFQPAEEGEGGALSMIESGALENVDEIFAIHLAPDLEKNRVGVRYGVGMAGVVEFDVDVSGLACHVAEREKGKDAFACAHEIAAGVFALSNNLKGKDALLHIGSMCCGTSRNIVAKQAKLMLTLRFFEDGAAEKVLVDIEKLMQRADAKFGTQSKLTVQTKYIPVKNAKTSVDKVLKVCKENIVMLDKKYTAEDFAYYLDQVSGAILWLGVNGGENTSLHASNFNFDESCLEYGLETYVKLIHLED